MREPDLYPVSPVFNSVTTLEDDGWLELDNAVWLEENMVGAVDDEV